MKAEGLKQIIGKTIIDVVVAQNCYTNQHVFLVFSDKTYFEFYGEGFTCASGVIHGGGVAEVMKYVGGGEITWVYSQQK